MNVARKKTGVIYTCITGKYDELQVHAYIDPNWDYICFTNDKSILNKKNSIWEARNLEFDVLDDVRNQRWHKLHAHNLFPDHERSIWIDANIRIINEDFFGDIKKAISENRKISIADHPKRRCLYQEADACLILGKDKEELIKSQVFLMKKDNFPENFGLFETNIIYREHNDKKTIKIMDDWWWWVENYSRRDQLSLTYVLWKNNYKLISLNEFSYRNNRSVCFIKNENHITKEELLMQKKQLQDQVARVENCFQKKEKMLQSKISEIDFMRSSKFWKMREFYLNIKNKLKIRN